MTQPPDKKTPTWFMSWFNQLHSKIPWKKEEDLVSQPNITEPIHIQPNITISTVNNERRQSEQSHGSLTSDDQYSTKAASYYQRRDSSERSMLSELWLKAKRHHPHYPQYHHMNDRPMTRQRHSISSSFFSNSVDNTPSASRPNSVIYTLSQPTSPNFLECIRNYSSDEIEHFVLDQEDLWLTTNDRWRIKHELTTLAIDGLFSLPDIVSPFTLERHVLQIGCGDAAWAIDVALTYSRWMIVGLDDRIPHQGTQIEEEDDYEFPILSTTATAMITRKSMIPKNFKLIHCSSLLQGLRHLPDNTFDLIESRFLILTYTFEEYQQLMTECIRICKPNGHIELMEADLRIYHQRLFTCSVTQGLNNEVIQLYESKKLDPRLARRLIDLVVDPSLHLTVKARYVSLPIGVWGGRLGVLFRDDVHHLMESVQQEIGQTEDELEHKLEMMDKEMEMNRSFMNLHLLVYNKKTTGLKD
ncbi:hypothetical protein EDC96DRAFT_502793 [Choanephora cucurbitarum]|nr:hypothetical protein EDC96DRAFT_502793 [Choanephora cucurbitarum]